MWRPTLPRNHRAAWWFLLVALIAAATLCLDPCAPPAANEPPTGPRGDAPVPPPPEPLCDERAAAIAEPIERIPVPPAAPAAPPPSFAELVDRLAATALATSELANAERLDEARQRDDEARAQFAALRTAFPDAGEQALALLASLPPEGELPLDIARRAVLQMVLSTTFGERHELAEAAEDRSQIDPLVTSLLTVMQIGGRTGELGGVLLIDQPLLRLCHEPAVLELVEFAARDEFDRGIATRLLLTLWHNLQASGERSSDDLASMAMLLLGNADPSRRTAACRQLLLDERYRPVILAWVREHRDVEVAAQLGVIAARELPPQTAVRTLRELAAVLPSAPGAYMLLATRAEEVVAEEYFELLATDSHAAVRGDLICGIGMGQGSNALATVEQALDDPALQVRAQAVLTLSALDPARTEAALDRLLDDPRTAADAQVLHVAVLAVDNLAAGNLTAGNLVNTVDRLGQRLRAAPLLAQSRQRLEGILARVLPGGATSR